jgi:hypothetical protein
VRAESERDCGERNVLHGHHRRGVILFALFGILGIHHRDREHRRKRAMFHGDRLAQFRAGGGILDLLRFARAEREAVRIASVGTEHVKAPRLIQLVIRRERRVFEQRGELVAGDCALGESLHRTAAFDGV